jgi:hypothetical protein
MKRFDMEMNTIVPDALLPHDAIGYYVSGKLRALFPGRGLLQAREGHFAPVEYARAGLCTTTQREDVHAEVITHWDGPFSGLQRNVINAWYAVEWQGLTIDLLMLQWNGDTSYFLLADTYEAAERFYLAVCEWHMGLREEVLVFEGAYWRKDERLFKALAQATFENLVLDGTLKQEIQDDVQRFFAARELYETYGVPWKRGILFLGPPGNGKTHAVKAVINAASQSCLYVKSVANTAAIMEVFEQARRSAPCVLVLEDLDSLVAPSQRSVLLNELDGFAVNAGILTLATTNHPEKLDPALIDRPSRFDRKYHFDLPDHDVRCTYIRRWNETLQPALQIGEKTIADLAAATDGFSFAYLKELFVSATMRWMAVQTPGAMDEVVQDELILLLCQMPSADSGSGGKLDKSRKH